MAVCVLFLLACSRPSGGNQAPDLAVNLVQGPAAAVSSGRPAGWKDFGGKLAVLEFWATWCEPCRESIPHLNELAEKYKDKPVVFLSISDESRGVVADFLKKTPMAGWVAADGAAMFSAFGVTGRPTTILVDGSGRILVRTYPDMLGPAELDEALAGKAPDIAFSDEPAPPASGALFSLSISTASGAGSYATSPDSLSASAIPLNELVALACGLNPARVVLDGGVKNESFAVAARWPEAKDPCDAVLRGLELAAPLRLSRRREERSVYLVSRSRPGSGLARSAPSSSIKWEEGEGSFEAHHLDISAILGPLESKVGTPLIDQTGLSGKWDVRLSWDAKLSGSLERAISAQLGLGLTPARRSIEIVEASPASSR